MSRSPVARTVPVAVLTAFAGVLFLLWLALFAAFVLLDWPFDGPPSQRIAHGLLLAIGLTLATVAGQLWRTAIGMEPVTSVGDARYMLGAIAGMRSAMPPSM